jgi:hypothetical protein
MRRVQLQEVLVGVGLDLDEIGRINDVRQLAEIYAICH